MFASSLACLRQAKSRFSTSIPSFSLEFECFSRQPFSSLFNLSAILRRSFFQKKHLPLILFLSVFNVFITNTLEFWGLQYMETAKTCMIYNLSPLQLFCFPTLSYAKKCLEKMDGTLHRLNWISSYFFKCLSYQPFTLLFARIRRFDQCPHCSGRLDCDEKVDSRFWLSFLMANAFSFLFWRTLLSRYFLDFRRMAPSSFDLLALLYHGSRLHCGDS